MWVIAPGGANPEAVAAQAKGNSNGSPIYVAESATCRRKGTNMQSCCVVCGGAILAIHSVGEQVCSRAECRFVVSFRTRLPHQDFERHLRDWSWAIRAQDRRRKEFAEARQAANELEERENRARWRLALQTQGDLPPNEYPMLPVPHNTRRLVNLPERRKRAVTDWLTGILSEALALPGETGEQGGSPPDPLHPGARFLEAACTLCAGSCCLVAGNEAYLKPVTLLRVMRNRPQLRPRDILALYLSYLPNKVLEGGCAYQGEKGCTLPAELRSVTCHRYYCYPLRDFRRDYDPVHPPKGVVFMVRNREHWEFPLGADQGILKTVLVTENGSQPLD